MKSLHSGISMYAIHVYSCGKQVSRPGDFIGPINEIYINKDFRMCTSHTQGSICT